MMTQDECMDELTRRKYANPFQPFEVKTNDGKSYPVKGRQDFAGAGSWMMVRDERHYGVHIRVATVAAIVDMEGSPSHT